MRTIFLIFAFFAITITSETIAISSTQPEEITKMATSGSINDFGEIPGVLEDTFMPAVHLSTIINNKKRDVVLLGEVHIATKKESDATSKIIPYFDCLAFEGIDVNTYAEGKFFSWIHINVIGHRISTLFEWDRSTKNKSPSDQVAEFSSGKKSLHLEEGWKPPIKTRIFLILHPFISIISLLLTILISTIFTLLILGFASSKVISNNNAYITNTILIAALLLLAVVAYFQNKNKSDTTIPPDSKFTDFVTSSPERNEYMTKKLVSALKNDNSIERVLAVTGKAHTIPMAEILKKKYGFTEIPM